MKYDIRLKYNGEIMSVSIYPNLEVIEDLEEAGFFDK